MKKFTGPRFIQLTRCISWPVWLFLVNLTLFVSSPSLAQQPRPDVTVVADGVGDSPQGAVRNATENALKQVLGSYMDTETRVIEQDHTENGNRRTSESVEKEIREYSKGKIKSVERLSVDNRDGIYHAVVRVVVRQNR